jgi:hypothetical protein
MLWSLVPSPSVRALPFERGTRRGTRFSTNGVAPGRGTHHAAFGGGLLSADQPLGYLRFSSQILALQSLPRSTNLAAVGSRSLVLGAGRDNFRDSSAIVAYPFMSNIDNIRYNV